MRAAIQRFNRVSIIGIFLALVLSVALLGQGNSPAFAANSTPISGYAWSDTVGWISMSGSNYGLTMAANGTVTGYAWSDTIGWVSANSTDIASCQSGANSRVQSGTWNGWLRAIAGGVGGWDGCISMSGSSPTYSVAYDKQAGTFGGYAWGSTVVGWVNFSQVSTAGACTDLQGDNYCVGNDIYQHDVQGNACQISTCSYQCASGACIAPPHPDPGTDNVALILTPLIVPQDETVSVTWSIDNVKNDCTVVGNGDSWSSTADGSGHSAGARTSSPINKQTTYTLTCTGLDDTTYTESHTINIIPKFREI